MQIAPTFEKCKLQVCCSAPLLLLFFDSSILQDSNSPSLHHSWCQWRCFVDSMHHSVDSLRRSHHNDDSWKDVLCSRYTILPKVMICDILMMIWLWCTRPHCIISWFYKWSYVYNEHHSYDSTHDFMCWNCILTMMCYDS